MEAFEILELSIQVPCEKRLRMCFQDTYIAAVEAQLSTLSKPSHRRAAPARKRTEVWTAGDSCNYFSSKVRLEVGNGASKPSTWNDTKAKKALTMRDVNNTSFLDRWNSDDRYRESQPLSWMDIDNARI